MDKENKSNNRKVYTNDDMRKAVEAVKNEKMSQRAAAQAFNIPRTSLIDVLSLP